MISKTMQQQEFQARLKRVAAGGPNTLGEVYCGTIEDPPKIKGLRPETGERRKAPFPVALVMGLLIGVLAVAAVRYMRFRVSGTVLGGPDADMLMLADLVLAGTLAILLRAIFRFRSKAHGFGKFAGVVLAVLFMHNAVFVAPEPFTRVYSAQWVGQIMRETRPQSLFLAGHTIALTGQTATQEIAQKDTAPAGRGA